MRLKSYYSETVEAAMELARRDLGDEALLVNARPATPDQLHLGDYEVVFGLAGEESAPVAGTAGKAFPKTQDAREAQPSRANAAAPVVKRWTPPAHPSEANLTPDSPKVALSPGSATALVPEELPPIPVQQDPNVALGKQIADLRRVIAALSARIPAAENTEQADQSFNDPPMPEFDPTLGIPGAARKIVTLVGPAGTGKTTTLVKLAIAEGLAKNQSVQLITTDVHRVGAASHLRSITSLLGLTCRPADSVEVLDQLLEDVAGDLLLIDTPPDLSANLGLSNYLASHPEIDTHLVLAASMSSRAMKAAADAFRESRPGKLVLTKLDGLNQDNLFREEVQRASSCTGLPLSFFAESPEIPDGLQEASASRLTRSEDATPREMRATA